MDAKAIAIMTAIVIATTKNFLLHVVITMTNGRPDPIPDILTIDIGSSMAHIPETFIITGSMSFAMETP